MFENVVTLLDWLGIAAFTITGALAASRNQMDAVGFIQNSLLPFTLAR